MDRVYLVTIKKPVGRAKVFVFKNKNSEKERRFRHLLNFFCLEYQIFEK